MSTRYLSNVRARFRSLRQHQWTPVQVVALIAALSIVLGSLFMATYEVDLGAPAPHHIEAALVGNRADGARTVEAVESVASHKITFRSYPSVPTALHAIEEQNVYAALDVTSSRPTLYVASAAGASVARVLEGIEPIDPTVRVVDTHPIASADPNGVDIFYLMVIATIIGFITVLQVPAHARGLKPRHNIAFVLGFAIVASLVLAAVNGPMLHRPAALLPEEWGILALHLLAVASFASLMLVTVGRWALVPIWLLFIVLGNVSSGGVASPALLPQPFAFVSQWLPSGATVTALRNAIYFRDFQHARPFVVLSVWAIGLFTAWLVVAHRRQVSAPAPSESTPARPPKPALEAGS